MSFKDFQGIIDFDSQTVLLLESYLREREARLVQKIVTIVQPAALDTAAPVIPAATALLKLSDVIEVMKKTASALSVKDREGTDSSQTVDQILVALNRAFWSFAEVLESSAVELFQQVEHVSIDRWQMSTFQVISDLKDLLAHRTEELLWTLKRIEQPLIDYIYDDRGCSRGKWFSFRKSSIDKRLIQNLHHTDKFLRQQYELFVRRYHKFSDLYTSAEESAQRLKGYPVLALLEAKDYVLYLDVYKLLKLLELDRQPNKEVASDIVRALKYLSGIEQVVRLFRIYLNDFKEGFFRTSLEWKALECEEGGFQQNLDRIKRKIQLYRDELRLLLHTMCAYRSFLLKHDPNPYVRSRWGFSEWIVGPEPEKAKQLVSLIYSTEELDELFQHLEKALDEDLTIQQHRATVVKEDIDNLLHEMGQPLISRSMMNKFAGKLLAKLNLCDEIGSQQMSSVTLVNKTLSDGMREDWKYHVLHGFPAFHQIYRLHQGLVGYREDPSHAYRLEHFQRLFEQIEQWTAKGDIYSHIHEIELDINDMKTYLQEFLATVQRVEKEKVKDQFLERTIEKLSQQLLEYRYRFGQFFYKISSENADGRFLRNQFLFVDHYFESIENYLEEMKMM
jgi:hypothetical protein